MKFIDALLTFIMSVIFGLATMSGAVLISCALIYFLALLLITLFNLTVWASVLASILILLSILFLDDGYRLSIKVKNFFKNLL